MFPYGSIWQPDSCGKPEISVRTADMLEFFSPEKQRHGVAMRRILTFFANRRADTPAPGRRGALLAAAVLLTGFGFSPAYSGGLNSGKAKSVTTIQAPAVNCTCRYRGTDYHLGDAVCLNGPSGPRMATCDMVLNNTSWSMSESPCPTAEMTPLPQSVGWIGSNG